MTELDTKAAELMQKMDVADLRTQLAVAETFARELKADWTDKREVLLLATQLIDEAEKFKQRAEAAEAQLALVERYGADQWRRGNAGREPQEFGEWQHEVQP